MRFNLLIMFAFMAIAYPHWATGEESSAVSEKEEVSLTRKLLIEPSSTTVALGKASLTVGSLIHKGKFYVGGYQLKVVPYLFKSEEGMLELEASDATVQKMSEGTPVKFTGKATNKKNGKTKVITGSATPANGDKGSVTFSVDTDNGEMLFKTSYHFAEPTISRE